MNERDALRYASRRAMLLAALRDGDARMAARAASRLRVPGAALAPSEFRMAREASRTVGRAIVSARLPRRADAALRTEAAITAPPTSRRPVAAVAALCATLVVLLVMLGNGRGGSPLDEGGAPEQSASEPARAAILTVSRGRTIDAPPEIVVVAESPTPAPTAAPTASAAPKTAGPAATARSTGRTAAPGSGGGGGGSGSGGTGGAAKPTPTPTPAPVATPPVPPAGFGRFNIVVYDASTGRPLEGVCVIIGSLSCSGPGSLTDTSGRWSTDFPATSATTTWDASFVKTGYVTLRRTLQLAAGRTVTYQIFLRRS